MIAPFIHTHTYSLASTTVIFQQQRQSIAHFFSSAASVSRTPSLFRFQPPLCVILRVQGVESLSPSVNWRHQNDHSDRRVGFPTKDGKAASNYCFSLQILHAVCIVSGDVYVKASDLEQLDCLSVRIVYLYACI